MVKKEWKKLLKNPLLIVVMAAIILIPSIYSTLFLASMWDPYGQLDHLPVAVVNLDQPVTYNDQNLTVGDDLVQQLKDNTELDFHFVNEKDADDGIRSGKYYMVITIPTDFSANASTLMDDEPKQMALNYATNPGTNYIASKLSASALAKIETKVANEVTRTYAKTVFDQLKDIGNGMKDGADGANQIVDGTDQLLEGNEKVASNLEKLADSSLVFKNGSETLSLGLTEYTNGVSKVATGASDLKTGATSLVDGSKTLKAGTDQLNTGITSYTAGVDALQSGAAKLSGLTNLGEVYNAISTMKSSVNDGTQTQPSLKSAANQLATGLAQLDTAASTLANSMSSETVQTMVYGLKSAKDGLSASSKTMTSGADLLQAAASTLQALSSQYNDDYSIDQSNNQNAINEIKNIISQLTAMSSALENASSQLDPVANGLENLSSGLSDGLNALSSQIHNAATSADAISNGTKNLADGLILLENKTQTFPQAAKGFTTLTEGINALQSNNTTLNQGAKKVSQGATALHFGMNTLDQGLNTLKEGTDTLVSNQQKLLDGSNALSDGADQIHDGANQLAEGATKVQDGLSELNTGSKDLSSALSDGADQIEENHASEQTLDMFSSPVVSNETQISKVPNNGSAMSAYMMCVGLWVGALAFCLMYPLTQYDGKMKNGFSWWLSKASVAYPLAILMAFVMLFALHLLCGFSPVSLAKTVLIACIASCTFMSIMYFFNVLLGKIGSFVMLIFMVIQLAGSAGTYPIELSAGFVAKIHKYLPFSYVVEAFRKGICGEGAIGHGILILCLWMLAFTLLTILLFLYRSNKKRKGEKNLHDVLEAHGLA